MLLGKFSKRGKKVWLANAILNVTILEMVHTRALWYNLFCRYIPKRFTVLLSFTLFFLAGMEASCLSVHALGLRCSLVKVLWYGSGKGALMDIALVLVCCFVFLVFFIKKQVKILPTSAWWLFGDLLRWW